MDRRGFLKLAGAAGAAAATGPARADSPPEPDSPEFWGVLVDTTRCIGCRACERSCSLTHDLPVPDIENDDLLEHERPTSDHQWMVVNRYETSRGEVFVKRQCMHCWQPACTAACLTNAMHKTRKGPVIWHPDKCMGCRFCMVSCPFEIPKFEYNSWNPKIQKCNMCWERLGEGKKPACVESCPTDALMFGRKRDLMEIARIRIYNHPDKYVHNIYGEHEVGGTGWLYLSAVPFEELGFRTDLGTTPYPEFTRDFLYGVPLVLFGLPALLLGLSLLAEKESEP
ncbi:MAG: 4Fe-4S dicluster domain-containing protein [bacterium]|nr:4Fe-4S dicluster domain-containing protein [bacterium]